jgi:integrase/recombinase XerD
MEKQSESIELESSYNAILAKKISYDDPSYEIFFKEELHIRSWISQKRSLNTQRNYEREIRSFFNQFPGLFIKDISDKHIVLFVLKKRNLSASTQNFAKNVLSSLLQYCVRVRYITFNVAGTLDSIPVANQSGFRALSEHEVEQLIRSTDQMTQRDQVLIKTLFYTGMRVAEVVSLKWGSCSVGETHVQITIKGKGGKIRSILVSKSLWREIEKLRGFKNSRFDSHIFVTEKEPYRGISTTTAWRTVKSAAKLANLSSKVSTHYLRHTHAVLSLRGGAPISVLQQTLGHASLSTTGEYLKAFPTDSSGDFLPTFKKPRKKNRK